MSDDLRLGIEIGAKTSGLSRGLRTGRRDVRGFADGAKRDLGELRRSFSGVAGKLATLGVGVGMTKLIADSAKLDKQLKQIQQTAGASNAQQVALRQNLWRWSRRTGESVRDLKEGFNGLVQSGQSWDEAVATMEGVNAAMAVTSAQASVLGGALTVAGEAFDFDLAKPGKALELLDKMTVAGRLGNAELEDLSAIFGRIGVNARSAGMGFEKTLAFTEALSLVERSPERLATLADSTLRVFTNMRYMAAAQKATKVNFFDADGSRRDAVAVLRDIKAQYDTLTTDAERAGFIQKAFGKADLDTIKGLRTLLGGDTLSNVELMVEQIGGASGTLERDLEAAINNAHDSVRRLKAALSDAADGFAKPFKSAVNTAAKAALDNFTGAEMALLGVGGVAAAWAGGRLLKTGGKNMLGRVMGRYGRTGVGLAEGKALEATAGVTPVYVVNMPGGAGMTDGAYRTNRQVVDGWLSGGKKFGPAAAAYGIAAPVAAAALVAGGLYGAHKINQSNIKKRLAEQRYADRNENDLRDTVTGEYYRRAAPSEAELYNALHPDNAARRQEEQIARVLAERGAVNVEVNIDAEGRVHASADNMDTHVSTNVPHGQLVVYQGDN
jgi:TP901 family phage tail tape measure protein